MDNRLNKFRSDIEGLRAVAILLVMAFHVGLPGWSGGFFGVDIFFVISGYLITGLLMAELDQTGRISVLRFYARRARRLLPAAALMVTCTVVAGIFLLTPIEQERLAETAAATAAYISNFYFLAQSADYFAPDINTNPFLHTWSLGVEEQFYLVWPALMGASFFFGRSRRAVFIGCAVVTILSFAAWLIVSPSWAFFASPMRAWELGLGAMASFVPAKRAWGNVAGSKLGILALVAIVAAAVIFNGRSAPITTTMPTLATAALLIVGASTRNGWACRILGTAPMQLIGRLSYGWYLWHWPILVLAKLMVPWIALPGRLLCVDVALCLAWLSFVLIERPIRSSPALSLRPAAALLLAVSVTATTIAFALDGKYAAIREQQEPAYQAVMSVMNEPSALNNHDCLYPDTKALECVFSKVDSETEVVLFGDSVAAQWFPPIAAITDLRGWRLATLLKASCSPAGVGTDPGQKECSTWTAAALARITATRPALVILSMSTYGRAANTREGLRKTLASLNAANIPTLMILTTPKLHIDPPNCVLRAMRRGGSVDSCGEARKTAIRSDYIRMERVVAGDLAT